MHQRALRTVLLIQAIEETDRTGEVITLADRADASRAAIRESAPLGAAVTGATLSTQAEAFLERRAQRLLARLSSHSPAIVQLLTLAGGITWLGRFVLLLALLAGMSLAGLDGNRRINILAFPLVGLIAWNLFMYLVLLIAWIRSGRHLVSGRWSSAAYARWIDRRIEALLRQYTRFNVPLTNGLRRFAADWGVLSQPLLLLRAKRLLHLAAALVAIGLVIGLYVRGVAFRYEAGWESTFLDPPAAHAVLDILYGPAAAISGIPLASTEELRALRWTSTGGGGEAASWIHLIALTALLYIVLPRLLAAGAANVALWRFSRWPPLPGTLLGYARALVMSVSDGTALRETAHVMPYAYQPGEESIAGLRWILAAALGATLTVEVGDPIRYGDEEAIGGRLSGVGRAQDTESPAARPADWNVLLMSLAATPEVENHGALISGVRDWLAQHASASPLLVLIDEAPYASRMFGDPGLDLRVQERRKLWREFVAGYGLRACMVDLSRIKAGAPSELEARDAARAALWTASERS